MARVTVKMIGKITIDKQAAAKAMAAAVEKHLVTRVADHRDVNDKPLAPYSALYRLQLAAIGEPGDVNMSLTGGLMASIHLVRTEDTGGRLTLIFGARPGTSPARPRPPPRVFDRTKTPEQQARALALWRAAPKRQVRTPTHAQRLAWLARGTSHTPPRHLLGVSPRGRPPIVAAIERVKLFRS